MILKFFFFGRFNLSFLPKNKKKEIIKKTEIIITKSIILFRYRNINKEY